MSWDNCMKKKIMAEWGDDVGKAIDGIHHHDLHALMSAIQKHIGDAADPASILAKLTGWSLSCVFA